MYQKISEYHEFFLAPYPNETEKSVLEELSIWIENRFGTKVKKIAFLEGPVCMGVPIKRLEVYLYDYNNDYKTLVPDDGKFYLPEANINKKIIFNAALEIIRKQKAENYFSNLQVVSLQCFESKEIMEIAKKMYREEINEIQSFLLGDGVEKVWVVPPFDIMMIFFKSLEDSYTFHNSEKRLKLDQMLYKMAKSRDMFGFITLNLIKKNNFYAYTNIKNFAPNCDFCHYDLY